MMFPLESLLFPTLPACPKSDVVTLGRLQHENNLRIGDVPGGGEFSGLAGV